MRYPVPAKAIVDDTLLRHSNERQRAVSNKTRGEEDDTEASPVWLYEKEGISDAWRDAQRKTEKDRARQRDRQIYGANLTKFLSM